MPNHTTTKLTISADDFEEVKRFIAAVTTDKSNFDFNGVAPMPDELVGTTSPVNIKTAEEIEADRAEWVAAGSHGEWKPYAITKERYEELLAKYGAADWYTWAHVNWGTKWGAYDASEWELSEPDKSATVHYQTAWCPAHAFFVTASSEYPTIRFENRFADEGGGFLGFTVYEGGHVSEEHDFLWRSPEGVALREDLGLDTEDPDVDYDLAVVKNAAALLECADVRQGLPPCRKRLDDVFAWCGSCVAHVLAEHMPPAVTDETDDE